MTDFLPGVVYMYDPPDVHLIYGYLEGQGRVFTTDDASWIRWDLMGDTDQFRSYWFWLGRDGGPR
jgi:hypothetical protein